MIPIRSNFALVNYPNYSTALMTVEAAARTCYDSKLSGTRIESEQFIRKLIKRGHESVLEHVVITADIRCDLGVSHEIVRHRLVAYSQESTRYVSYEGGVPYVVPSWWEDGDKDENREWYEAWTEYCEENEREYMTALMMGMSRQQARCFLNKSAATHLRMTTNLREWRHIMKLRTDAAAHPDMRLLMQKGLRQMQAVYPVFFEGIGPDAQA